MDGLTRFVGIGLIVGLGAVSVVSYNETIQGAAPVGDDSGLMLPIEVEARESEPQDTELGESDATTNQAAELGQPGDIGEARIETGEATQPWEDLEDEPPALLAFADGYRPGHYSIEYNPMPTEPIGDESDGELETVAADEADEETPPSGPVNASQVEPGTMPPGLYATAFGVEDCSYQIRREIWQSRTLVERVIGEDYLPEGRLLVSFNEVEPDVFTSRPACGDWVPWSPLAEPLTTASNGDYWIGDLAKGLWSAPSQCMWEKVVGFRGAELVDVQQSGVSPQQLIVDDETLGIRIRGCSEPLKLLTG